MFECFFLQYVFLLQVVTPWDVIGLDWIGLYWISDSIGSCVSLSFWRCTLTWKSIRSWIAWWLLFIELWACLVFRQHMQTRGHMFEFLSPNIACIKKQKQKPSKEANAGLYNDEYCWGTKTGNWLSPQITCLNSSSLTSLI